MILLCSAYCRRALCIARHSGAHWNLMARSKCYLEINEPLDYSSKLLLWWASVRAMRMGSMPNSSNVTKLIERVNLKPHILPLKSSVMKVINKIKTTELMIRTSWLVETHGNTEASSSKPLCTLDGTESHVKPGPSRQLGNFCWKNCQKVEEPLGSRNTKCIIPKRFIVPLPPVAIQVTLVTVG